MYVDQARIKYQELRDLGYSQPVPCTVEEVEELEHWIGQRLPEAYREFLPWMGHSGGGLLRGSDCFYPHLKDIQNGAKELLKENDFPGTLPEQTFVFFMHQGYQFNFFYLGEGDDPLGWIEGYLLPTGQIRLANLIVSGAGRTFADLVARRGIGLR